MTRALDIVPEIVSQMRTLGVPYAVAQAIEELIVYHARRAHPTELSNAPSSLTPHVVAIARHFHTQALRRAELLEDHTGDLAWHMLLFLVVENGAGRGVPVTSLCYASGGPLTTALRHIGWMEERGYLWRRPDPKDARSSLIFLADHMREKMYAAVLADSALPTAFSSGAPVAS